MKKSPCIFAVIIALLASSVSPVEAQEYKMKQANTMGGMTTNESTIYVKGSRKRTESAGMMGMGAKTVVIEQCDLQRTVKLNDNKNLYFIIPFAKDNEEIIDEDAPAPKTKPAVVIDKTAPKKGGTIYSWYYIYDTLVRETMFGFPARHIQTWRKMKPSADACYMKDSMEIRTDGWYIDLPEFKCPIVTRPERPPVQGAPVEKPDCQDKFISRQKGKGKLGFPLKETRTMTFAGQTSTMEMSSNVVEFSKTKLDSSLFVIPPGYTQAAKEEDLNESFSMADMIKNAQNQNNNNPNNNAINNVTIKNSIANDNKQPGMIRIGVFEPKGDGGFQAAEIQKNMAVTLTTGNIEGVVITSAEDAKTKNCDYTLSSDISKFKSGSKLGGLIKAIKNSDPNAVSTFTVEASLTLVLLSDGSVKTNPKVDGKYDGKPDDAATKAMNDGCVKVLKAFQ